MAPYFIIIIFVYFNCFEFEHNDFLSQNMLCSNSRNVADNVFSGWILVDILLKINLVVFTDLRVGDIIQTLYLQEIYEHD